MPLQIVKNTKYKNNIPAQVAAKNSSGKASATPTTSYGVQQLTDLSKYINGSQFENQSVGDLVANRGAWMADVGKDLSIDPNGVNNPTWTVNPGNTNVSITNDNKALANAISSAASQLSNVYQGYVNAQTAAANAANAASKEAQQTQFNMNKQLMDMQNQETRNLMQWQMDYNTSSAKEQRDWEERMSNTAYQRAVQDLKAAGLNPILAYTNGAAQTPSGSTASPVSGSAAGSSVGSYSGASYHINDTMAVMGSVLGVLGNYLNSAKTVQGGYSHQQKILEAGDSILNALDKLFTTKNLGILGFGRTYSGKYAKGNRSL